MMHGIDGTGTGVPGIGVLGIDVRQILADLGDWTRVDRRLDRSRSRFDPALLTELCPPEVGGRELSLAEAERELERLHRVELGRLLREAAAIRLSRGPMSVLIETSTLAPDFLVPCLQEELSLAALDGISGLVAEDCSVVRVARGCLGDDVEAWPSTLVLAIASLLLAPHATGRLRLGQGLLEAGWHEHAEGVLRASLRATRKRVLQREPGARRMALHRSLSFALTQACAEQLDRDHA